MVRRIGNMIQLVGQSGSQAARSNATSNTLASLSAGGVSFIQGEIVRGNDDGSYDIFVSSPTEGGVRTNANSTTDEPLQDGALVWVSKTVYGTWVIIGAVRG